MLVPPKALHVSDPVLLPELLRTLDARLLALKGAVDSAHDAHQKHYIAFRLFLAMYGIVSAILPIILSAACKSFSASVFIYCTSLRILASVYQIYAIPMTHAIAITKITTTVTPTYNTFTISIT